MSIKTLKWIGIGACVLMGALVGYLIWALITQRKKVPVAGDPGGASNGPSGEDQKGIINWGAWIGAILVGVYFILKAINTVNYILYQRGVRVYDGITMHYRLAQRIREHQRSGKVFDSYYSSGPNFRFVARDIERQRIWRFRSRYNIQHNY